MIVDLNDKKFSKAKQGDIFVIEENKGKKVAVPITKEELLKSELETLRGLQKQINELKNSIKKQNKVIKSQNEKIDAYCKSIHNFITIMNGGKANEETI